MEKRKYDSTVARIAGNIAGGIAGAFLTASFDPVRGTSLTDEKQQDIIIVAVDMARRIVAEVERTEPPAVEGKG